VLSHRRAIKWISWSLAGLVVLALLAVAVLVWLVDPNSYKPRIEAAVREATGREFALVGDIDLKFFPWLALRTGAGRFGNPPGFPAEPMASWRSAQLGVKLFPLLGGSLVVDKIRLEGADVQLILKADGTANWQGIAGDEPAQSESKKANAKKRHLTIDGVELRDSRLVFVDEGTPRSIEMKELNLSTDEIAPDQPFTDTELSGRLHMEGFAPEGAPFRFASPKIALTEDYSKLEMENFELEFAGFEGEGGLRGSFGETLTLSGSIDSNTFDPRAVLASVGIEAPKTTDPKALGQLQLAATWSLDGKGMRVDPLSMTLDDTHFKGNFQRGAGEDPVGAFELHGDVLNISRYIPPEDPESEPFVLPVAALKALKFRGLLELEQATLDDIEMKGVTLRLLLDEQGLRVPPAQGKQS
jgi:AsmA protein